MKRSAILREAYQQYLDGKRSLDSVLDLSDHMRDFVRGGLDGGGANAGARERETAGPGEGGAVKRASALHEAYQRCLDGKVTLDEVLEMADRFLDQSNGRKPFAGEASPAGERE